MIVLGLLLVGGVYLYLIKFAPQAELTEESEEIFSVEPEEVKNYIEKLAKLEEEYLERLKKFL